MSPRPDRREEILRGGLLRVLFKLSWPLVIRGQISVLLTIIMLYWLGQLVPEEGLAVHAITRPVFQCLLWLFGALALGSSVLVSWSVGAEDDQGIHILANAFSCAFVLFVPIAIIGTVLSPVILGGLAGDLEIRDSLRSYYFAWLLAALPAITLSEIILQTVGATGWTQFGLLRVVLDLVLTATVMPFLLRAWGISGAPIVTALSASLLVLMLVAALRRYGDKLRMGHVIGSLRDLHLWRQMLAIGFPVQAARAFQFVAQVVLVQLVVGDGKVSVAGYGLAIELVLLVAMTLMALSRACAIIIGQALGADAYARARSAFVHGLGLVVCLAVLATLVTPYCRPALELFTDDTATVDAGFRALKTMRWALVGLASYQLLMATYSATGRTGKAGMAIVVAELGGLAVAFSITGPGLRAATIAFCVANTLKPILLASLFRPAFLEPTSAPQDPA